MFDEKMRFMKNELEIGKTFSLWINFLPLIQKLVLMKVFVKIEKSKIGVSQRG